ncbi:MAG: hypothetical protein ICV69_15850 [Thermoleophilaceae bacterium]|nr:hypothetical protein [Thermoleophilaceae bacterium]
MAELAFAAAGSSLSDQSGGAQVMLMGFNMTVPMVIWMSYRGHAAARNVEMALSMVVPSIFAAVVAWAGVLESAAALGVQHAVRVPAMLGVMLTRYEGLLTRPLVVCRPSAALISRRSSKPYAEGPLQIAIPLFER